MTHDAAIFTHPTDPPASREWTDEHVGQLKAMLAQECGYGEIGDVLNRSKGSIASLVKRLGIELPPNYQTKQMMKGRGWTGQSTGRTLVAPALTVAYRAEDFTDANVHGIANLEDHHCRFICNDDFSSPVYCGRHHSVWSVNGRERASSYCEFHHRICHRPETQSAKAAA